jgi:ribosome-associated toxin RatA of RatAB toxin-antitoxin module
MSEKFLKGRHYFETDITLYQTPHLHIAPAMLELLFMELQNHWLH